MWGPISGEALLVAAVVAVVAHVALLWLYFSSRSTNVLYLITGAYLVISPLSLSMTLPGGTLIKVTRIYLTLLLLLFAIKGYGVRRLGPASLVFSVFLAFYVIAAFWSKQPVAGLAYKSGTSLFAFLAGVALAYGTRDSLDLLKGLRWLTVVAGFLGLGAVVFLWGDISSLHMGRLQVLGIGPNQVGQTAAMLLILTASLTFYDQSWLWRAFAAACSIPLSVALVFSGSRTSLGMAAIGIVVAALPLMRHIGRFVVAGVVVASIVVGLVMYTPTEQLRLGSLSFSNRAEIWDVGWRAFMRSPLIGQGWWFGDRLTTYNLHNMYLQILAETGVLGMIVFCVCLLYVAYRALWMYSSTRRFPETARVAGLPLACLVAMLIHGVAESATLMGTTLNTLFLGFGVGLVDRVPQFVYHEAGRALRQLRVRSRMFQARWGRRGLGPQDAT